MEKQGKAGDSPSRDEVETIFENFLEIMEMSATDPVFGHRLALAQTITHIHLTDADDLTLSLLMDREPVEIRSGAVGDPEVEIFMSSSDIDSFWAGDLHLAMAIAEGKVQYTGPVRKFLRIVPIALRLTPTYLQMRNGGSHES